MKSRKTPFWLETLVVERAQALFLALDRFLGNLRGKYFVELVIKHSFESQTLLLRSNRVQNSIARRYSP
jgi:hypothetical protein